MGLSFGLGLPPAPNKGVGRVPRLSSRAVDVADKAYFDSWIGRQSELVMAFCNLSTWDLSVADCTAKAAAWAGKWVEWGFPLCTTTQNNAATTAGTYDTQINAMLDTILAHRPSGTIYLRLGWEAGYSSAMPWSAKSGAGAEVAYMAAFQHVAALIRAKSSRIKINWTVTPYATDYLGAEVDSMTFYPGDAYVDIIGWDAYLTPTLVAYQSTFATARGYTYGIDYLAAIARAKGKPMAFPEWGICAERPDYIRDLAAFCADRSNNVLYVGYWNQNGGGNFNDRITPDGGHTWPIAQSAMQYYFGSGGAAYFEDALTAPFTARMTAVPALGARRAAYNALVASLRSSGVLAKLDDLRILMGDSQSVTLNLVGADATNLSATGAPSVTTDRYVTGDGSTSYYSTLFNPGGGGSPKFVRDSAHMGIWSETNIQNGAGNSVECGATQALIGRNTSGFVFGKANTAANLSMSASANVLPAHFMWSRTAANAWASYVNGVQNTTGTDASVAVPSGNLSILRAAGGTFGANSISFYHVGAGLNGTEVAALYGALSAFRAAIRAL